jgi:membrane-bound serine protease (ClpP class)
MVIAHPQVAYLLMTLGMLGLMVELFSPGLVVPGVAGGISLLLALYAFSVLPVNWVGVLLIAAGVGLAIAEAFATSYGLLTIAGLVSFVFGSLILIDTPIPHLRIGLELVIPITIAVGVVSGFLATRAWRASRSRVRSGVEALIGETGELTHPIEHGDGEGKVFVHGEYWAATATQPLPEGAKVRVEEVQGLRLRVAPATTQST